MAELSKQTFIEIVSR